MAADATMVSLSLSLSLSLSPMTLVYSCTSNDPPVLPLAKRYVFFLFFTAKVRMGVIVPRTKIISKIYC